MNIYVSTLPWLFSGPLGVIAAMKLAFGCILFARACFSLLLFISFFLGILWQRLTNTLFLVNCSFLWAIDPKLGLSIRKVTR
jgi:hypothetical protein